MNQPLISVIIPVYNVEKHIDKCLNSVINQTYKNLEIILINDGSTDNSAEICRNYSLKDNRIIFLSRENRGVSSTRNEGIEFSHGDYYSFIDADDYLELDTYEYLLNIIEEKSVDAVNFEYYITYPNSETTHKLKSDIYGYADKKTSQHNLLFYYPFACNKLFSKNMISNVRFDEEIARGEDSLFARRAYNNCCKTWFDSRPMLHYVQSKESACRGKFKTTQLTAVKLFDVYNKWYSEEYPELLPYCLLNLNNLMISLYFDMWMDKSNYKKQQKEIFSEFKKHFDTSVCCTNISTKQKIKMKLFKISPNLFCILHYLRIRI